MHGLNTSAVSNVELVQPGSVRHSPFQGYKEPKKGSQASTELLCNSGTNLFEDNLSLYILTIGRLRAITVHSERWEHFSVGFQSQLSLSAFF
jgi:hypothetical protein